MQRRHTTQIFYCFPSPFVLAILNYLKMANVCNLEIVSMVIKCFAIILTQVVVAHSVHGQVMLLRRLCLTPILLFLHRHRLRVLTELHCSSAYSFFVFSFWWKRAHLNDGHLHSVAVSPCFYARFVATTHKFLNQGARAQTVNCCLLRATIIALSLAF